MSTIINKGWVASSGTFTYQLYAIDTDGFNQRIAEITDASLLISADSTNIANSMLIPGGATFFSISAVDTTAVGYWSRYRLTYSPEHSIPSLN